jgi:hypothetical protein
MELELNRVVFPDSHHPRLSVHTEQYLGYLEMLNIGRLQSYYEMEKEVAKGLYDVLLGEAKHQFGSEFLSLNLVFLGPELPGCSVVMLHKDPSLPLTKENIKPHVRDIPSKIEYEAFLRALKNFS